MIFPTSLARASLVSIGLALSSAAAWSAPVVLQPDDGKDTEISAYAPAANQGGDQSLVINWFPAARSVGLLEFDLSPYMGSSVTSAALSLFHWTNSNLGVTYSLFRVTSAWDENTVTFNTAPTIDATPVASMTIGDSTAAVFRDWDVTTVVNGWLSNAYANYGLWIEEVPIDGSGSAFFASSDRSGADQDPRLTMDLMPAVVPVPEPGSLSLAALAVVGAALAGRRRRGA